MKERLIETTITTDSNRNLFDSAACHLESLCIRFDQQINGTDQMFWDFHYKGFSLILHLEHYLGISIFSGDKDANEIIRKLVENIKEELID